MSAVIGALAPKLEDTTLADYEDQDVFYYRDKVRSTQKIVWNAFLSVSELPDQSGHP